MARKSKSGDHSYSRTAKIRGRESEGLFALVVRHPEHSRVARIRADGTADASTEELVPTSELVEIKSTHIVPIGQRGTFTLPAELRRNLSIEENTPLQIIEEDGWFSVRPLRSPSPKIQLNDLLSRITPENLHGEFSTGDPVGREAW